MSMIKKSLKENTQSQPLKSPRYGFEKYIIYPPANLITPLLIKLKLTSDQTSILALILTIAGGVFIVLGYNNYFYNLTGIAFWAIAIILDLADGEIARRTGNFGILDKMKDSCVHTVWYFSISLQSHFRYNSDLIDFLCFCALAFFTIRLGVTLNMDYRILRDKYRALIKNPDAAKISENKNSGKNIFWVNPSFKNFLYFILYCDTVWIAIIICGLFNKLLWFYLFYMITDMLQSVYIMLINSYRTGNLFGKKIE